jgi:hypothetical protein
VVRTVADRGFVVRSGNRSSGRTGTGVLVGLVGRSTVAGVVVALLLSGTGLPVAQAAGTSDPAISTLGTSPERAQQEAAAGVDVAMMELSWREYEPRPGVFDTGYEREMLDRAAALHAAGMRITLGLGLHFVPDWVYDIPNSRFVSQSGQVSDEVNLVFNKDVRFRANDYVHRIAAAFDLNTFDTIRVSSGSRSEVLYPSGDAYWGFDANALGGNRRPRGVAANPFPSWTPGTDGLTDEQKTQWAHWYVDSLADAAGWQMRLTRRDGFTGRFEVLTPGVGVYARKLASVVAADLPTSSPLAVGALWDRLYADLAKVDSRIDAYVSSMADGSGGDDSCAAGDDRLPLADPATVWWGATRWISRIADEHGMGKVGEIPGERASDAGTAAAMMSTGMRQAASCGFSTVYWAHDDSLWDGTVSFSTWAAFA